MKYYSAIKRNKFKSVLRRWMNLEPVVRSEVSQKEKNIHIKAYIWDLEKWCWLTYMQGKNRDAGREQTCGQSGERRAWTNWESSIETCRSPYVEYMAMGSCCTGSNWCSVKIQRGGMAWGVERKFKRERIYAYLWLIHVDVWQKPNTTL